MRRRGQLRCAPRRSPNLEQISVDEADWKRPRSWSLWPTCMRSRTFTSALTNTRALFICQLMIDNLYFDKGSAEPKVARDIYAPTFTPG